MKDEKLAMISRMNGLVAAGAVLVIGDGGALAQGNLAEVQLPEPGYYEQKVTVVELTVPGAPEDAIAKMRQMIEEQSSQSACETTQDDFLDFRHLGGLEQDCTVERLETTPDSFSMILFCAHPAGRSSTMSITGKTRSDSMDTDVFIYSGAPGNAEARSMTMQMKVGSQRIGDCEG